MTQSVFTQKFFFCLLILFPILLVNEDLLASEIPIIDAHSQIDHKVNLEKVIKLMNKAGVKHTILSTRGKVKPEQLIRFANKHKNLITPAIRTKGKIYANNSPKYYKYLDKQLRMREFGAMAEVILWHAKKGDKAPQWIIEPDDRRVVAALNAAIEKLWPFIVHIEFAAAGSDRNRFKSKFLKMVKDNPNHPFVLIHMGQLESTEVNRLLTEHSNLYFITSHSNPVVAKSSKQPWVNLFNGSKLSTQWRSLIVAFPDRFILGFDNVWPAHWGKYYLKQVSLWRNALADLPDEVAHALAHKNAERLWKLTPVH